MNPLASFFLNSLGLSFLICKRRLIFILTLLASLRSKGVKISKESKLVIVPEDKQKYNREFKVIAIYNNNKKTELQDHK